MDENIKKVVQIYQKHNVFSSIGMCCSEDHKCETAILLDEIKRLNKIVESAIETIQSEW